ncbi:MAG TPA: DUF2799 domain-containing protein [Pseudobdellovibrionaceae bacterium]|nr:DUF2799 domain-containing protein [Pseudobdellovibrionaceae bacterium]
MVKVSILGLLMLGLSGCASWSLKESCEKTNWFEYSQKVANEGRYLEEDAFVKQCKSVEKVDEVQLDQGFKLGREKMCSYDQIQARGRDGVPVFFDFCTGLDSQKMRASFAEGLKSFCTAEKSYTYGRSGKVYQKVCSPQAELKFLPGYQKGRVEYLKELIGSLEKERVEILTTVSGLENSERLASRNLDLIPAIMDCSDKLVYNETQHKDERKRICEEPYYLKSQRETMMSQVSGIRSKLAAEREKLSKLDEKLSQSRQFLAELPK